MPRSSSDSDSELEIPASISRINLRRDVGMAGRATSPIVTAAAKRQLRGGKGERKTAREVAAEIRNKEEQTSMEEGPEDLPSEPASAQARHDLGTTMDLISSALGSALEATHHHHHPEREEPQPTRETPQREVPQPTREVLQPTEEALNESKNSATSIGPGQKLVAIRRKGTSTPGKESTSATVGIGVKFTQTLEGEHMVTSLLPGGPADLTKQVEVNDKIVAVDGNNLKGKTSEQIISLIVGPPGTIVELLLEPQKNAGPLKQETSPRLSTPLKASPPATASRSASPPAIVAASPAPPITPAPPDKASPPAPAFASSKRSYGRQDAGGFSTPEQPPAPAIAMSPPVGSIGGGTPGGVGVKFQAHADKSVTVAVVMHNSPAEDSRRIHPSDRVLLVDGKEVEGKTPAEVDQMTAGAPGSNVVLTLQSAFDKQVRSVTLHRKHGHANEGVTISSPPLHQSPAPNPLPVNRAWQPEAAAPPIHPKEEGVDKEGAGRRGQEESEKPGAKKGVGGAPAPAGDHKGGGAKKEARPKEEEIKPAAPPAHPALTKKQLEVAEQQMQLEMQSLRHKVDNQLHAVENSNQTMFTELQALHVKVQNQEKLLSKQEGRIQALEERPQGCACVIS